MALALLGKALGANVQPSGQSVNNSDTLKRSRSILKLRVRGFVLGVSGLKPSYGCCVDANRGLCNVMIQISRMRCGGP